MPKKTTEMQPATFNDVDLRRILLVDDDFVILTMLSAWLEDKGYEVRAVENGDEAVSELPLFKPDLVITDLRMEGMDGMTLLEEIQKVHSRLPVILLSASAPISDDLRAMHQNIFEFLRKPVDPDELFQTVDLAFR